MKEAAEGVAADPRLRVGEAAEDALELVAHAGPTPSIDAPRSVRGAATATDVRSQARATLAPAKITPDRMIAVRHLEGLVHAPTLPSVLAIDERGAQPEQQGRDDEEQELAEEVGVDRRHVDDDRRAQQQDRVEDPVVAVDRVGGREGGREHEDAEADGIRRHLRRVAGAEHDDSHSMSSVRRASSRSSWSSSGKYSPPTAHSTIAVPPPRRAAGPPRSSRSMPRRAPRRRRHATGPRNPSARASPRPAPTRPGTAP